MVRGTEAVNRLSELISEAKRIVVFTGAGISTESGIADYRSKGGLWERFQPVTIQEFVASPEKRKQYWQIKLELYHSFQTARPNAGHLAITQLEMLGKLRGLITQNIDGLHQLAGTGHEKILELHGSNRETICLSCGDLTPWPEVYERLKSGEEALLCKKCQGLLKPNTISFGQSLDPEVLQKAVQWARDCDLFLAVGSTLIVEPAASLPRVAKQAGAKLVIITLSDTPLDFLADLRIHASIADTLAEALKLGQEKTGCERHK